MASRLAPLAGVAAVVLSVISVAVAGDIPDAEAPVAEVAAFYKENEGETLFSSLLGAYAALLFLVFLSSWWTTLRSARPERRMASILTLAGGVLFSAGLTIFAAIGFVLGDLGDELDPVAVQTLNALNESFFFPAAVGLAAFLFGSGASIVQTGVLPAWFGWLTIALALLAVTPLGFFAFIGMGLWLIGVGIVLALRAGREPASPAPAAPS